MYGPACPQGPDTGRFLKEGFNNLIAEAVCGCCFWKPEIDRNGNPITSRVLGKMSEDCLNLNLTTPAADDKKRPVMVWIHGGAWSGGSNILDLDHHSVNTSILTERGDVVVVAMNYRVNVFGALHQPDAGITNLGFKDMIAGLEWVRDNVANFGGDPSNVTIFGESAGANSVAVLYGSPPAKDLFAKGICSSGSWDGFWTKEEFPIVKTQFGQDCGLGLNYTTEDYLTADANDMCAAAMKSDSDPALVTNQGSMQINYAPMVDDEIILTGGPQTGVEQGISKDKPLLTGWNADEWFLFTTLPADIFEIPEEDEAFARTIHKMFRRRYHSFKDLETADAEATWQKLAMALVTVYRKQYPDMVFRERAIKLITELQYAFPALDMGTGAAAAGAPVYYYTLGLESANGLRCCHGMDIGLYFGVPLSADAYGKQVTGDGLTDERVRKATETVMDSWINFAKNGNPGQAGWEPNTKRFHIAKENSATNEVVDRDLPTYLPFLKIEQEMMDEIKATRKIVAETTGELAGQMPQEDVTPKV